MKFRESNLNSNKVYHSPFNIAVLVAGIGFFIDAFDLFLFNVYRIPSLKDLGLSGTELTTTGELGSGITLVSESMSVEKSADMALFSSLHWGRLVP